MAGKTASLVSIIKYYANIVFRRYKALHIFGKVQLLATSINSTSQNNLDIHMACHAILHMLRFVDVPYLLLLTQ